MSTRRVTVQRRFRRSIRVDSDQRDAAAGFVWTPTAERAIEVMAEHVTGLGHGSFTWTGTYGCGKSSLAALLAALVSADGARRARLLADLPAETADDLARTFWDRIGDWRVVPVVGRRDDAATVIGASLSMSGSADPARILDALVAPSADRGTLIILDEMGKLLEHAASGHGDAHFFQELAEAANRSDGRLVVVGILHQAFDDYSARLSREVRDEWLKVQGRYVDVQLSPTSLEQIGLLSKAIVAEGAPDTRAAAETVAGAIMGERAGRDQLAGQLAACSPLSPVAAALLGPLSKRRFGQNQRSLFGFLGSAEPHGFQEFLLGSPDGLYDPAMLWSYLRTNLEPSILASPDAHRWSVAIDAVERCESRADDELTTRVAKAIALLDLLRDRSGLVATTAVLQAALPDVPADAIDAAVERLVAWSIAVHRRHLGGYSLYAGSDFDIEAALESARRDVPGADFSRLRESGVLVPILAKRHYHDTGAMRWFDIEVASLDEAMTFEPRAQRRGAAGTFLLVVNDAGLSKAALRSRITRLADRFADQPVAVGLTGQSYLLREMTQELAALERVQAHSPELKSDPVARREVAGRLARLSSELEERLRDSLAFARWSVPMLPDLELDDRRADVSRLTVLASTLADALFPEAPRIRNELVNRTRPSSNAMAALRALMTAMVRSGHEERLGIVDYPPEMGLYISTLERTGLHRPDDPQRPFVEPDGADPARLAATWRAADDLLDDAGPEGVTLDAVQLRWSGRPFGVRAGLLPLLSLGYLLSRLDRLSVYLDGAFCSAVSDLLVDRMLQEPSAVRLRLSVVSHEQRAILRSVGDLLAEVDGRPAEQSAEPLALARRLVGYVLQLPGWVRRTGRVDATARAVRDLATAAHDPNRFLLDDLPAVLSEGPDDQIGNLRKGLRQLAVAYGDLLAGLTATMLDELRVGPGPEELARLRDRARNVAGISGNYRLDAFATRLGTFDGTQAALEGILSLAANKPPRDWTDRDVDAARIEVAALAQEFLRIEGLAHVHGRQDNRTRVAVFISDPDRPSLLKSELTVGSAELTRARLLAGKLRSVLGQDLPPDIALAAVAELGARLMEEARGDVPSTASDLRGAA